MLLSLQCIMLHSPSLGASRAVRGLPRGSDKFEPKLHLLLPFPSTLPPCALLFFCHFLHCACSRVCNQRTGLDTQASGIVGCGALSSHCASLTESCQQCCECLGLAAPSQRRDGGVVESSRNWPDRYCRPAKIITCWNGNPVSLQGRDGPRNGCKRSPSRDLDQILRNISTFQDGFLRSMVFDR